MSSSFKDAQGFTELHRAVMAGQSDKIVQLLQERVEPNPQSNYGTTPMHLAAYLGHAQVIETLLRWNADATIRENKGLTALHLAAENNHIQAVEVLLKDIAKLTIVDKVYVVIVEKTNVNVVDNENATPLHLAAQAGNSRIVTILLEAGAEIDAAMAKDVTPLHLSAAKGHSEVVNILIKANARIDATTNKGATPLYMAAQNGHSKTVEILVAAGIKAGMPLVDISSDEGFPLHVAAYNGHIKVVIALLGAGAKIDAITKEGATPLHLAIQNGHSEIVNILIKAGAKVDAITKEGATPLHYAAQYGHSEITKMLLEYAKIDTETNKGVSPLYLAVGNKNSTIANILIKAGAKVDAKLLHIATNNGDIKTVKVLLATGLSVDTVFDNNNIIALHVAVLAGYTEIVRLLLDKGADINIKMSTGMTAITIAEMRNDKEMSQLLLETQERRQKESKSSALYVPTRTETDIQSEQSGGNAQENLQQGAAISLTYPPIRPSVTNQPVSDQKTSISEESVSELREYERVSRRKEKEEIDDEERAKESARNNYSVKNEIKHEDIGNRVLRISSFESDLAEEITRDECVKHEKTSFIESLLEILNLDEEYQLSQLQTVLDEEIEEEKNLPTRSISTQAAQSSGSVQALQQLSSSSDYSSPSSPSIFNAGTSVLNTAHNLSQRSPLASRQSRRWYGEDLISRIGLPLPEELDKIIGIDGLVRNITVTILNDGWEALVVTFDSSIPRHLYEPILKEKLFGSSIIPWDTIPNTLVISLSHDYDQFMDKVQKALEEMGELPSDEDGITPYTLADINRKAFSTLFEALSVAGQEKKEQYRLAEIQQKAVSILFKTRSVAGQEKKNQATSSTTAPSSSSAQAAMRMYSQVSNEEGQKESGSSGSEQSAQNLSVSRQPVRSESTIVNSIITNPKPISALNISEPLKSCSSTHNETIIIIRNLFTAIKSNSKNAAEDVSNFFEAMDIFYQLGLEDGKQLAEQIKDHLPLVTYFYLRILAQKIVLGKISSMHPNISSLIDALYQFYPDDIFTLKAKALALELKLGLSFLTYAEISPVIFDELYNQLYWHLYCIQKLEPKWAEGFGTAALMNCLFHEDLGTAKEFYRKAKENGDILRSMAAESFVDVAEGRIDEAEKKALTIINSTQLKDNISFRFAHYIFVCCLLKKNPGTITTLLNNPDTEKLIRDTYDFYPLSAIANHVMFLFFFNKRNYEFYYCIGHLASYIHIVTELDKRKVEPEFIKRAMELYKFLNEGESSRSKESDKEKILDALYLVREHIPDADILKAINDRRSQLIPKTTSTSQEPLSPSPTTPNKISSSSETTTVSALPIDTSDQTVLNSQNKKDISSQHVSTEKIIWEGDVPAGYVIESTGGAVIINGNVGEGAVIKSKFYLTINGNAGKKSSLTAGQGAITVRNAEEGTIIHARHGSVKLENVEDNVTIKAQATFAPDADIRIKGNIGKNCTITSDGSMSCKNVDTNTKIEAEYHITADNINGATVISKQGKVRATRIEDGSTVRSDHNIEISDYISERACHVEAGRNGYLMLKGKIRPNILPPIASSSPSPYDPTISKDIDLTRYSPQPFLTQTIQDATAQGDSKRINVYFYALLGQTGSISNIESNPVFNFNRNEKFLQVCWGDVTKSIPFNDLPAVCDLKFYEEHFGTKTRLVESVPVSRQPQPSLRSHTSSSPSLFKAVTATTAGLPPKSSVELPKSSSSTTPLKSSTPATIPSASIGASNQIFLNNASAMRELKRDLGTYANKLIAGSGLTFSKILFDDYNITIEVFNSKDIDKINGLIAVDLRSKGIKIEFTPETSWAKPRIKINSPLSELKIVIDAAIQSKKEEPRRPSSPTNG